ncbi:MAG: histidinol-phosphate transaminase [Rhodospirillaceae bacterium]|nr:histidinol-phosphate transaminase [Rhodospirillaceae bacterium]
MTSGVAVRPRAGVDAISPYKAGEAVIPGRAAATKLSSNESPFGPGQAVLDAIAVAAGDARRYPDSAAMALRTAIADHFELDVGGIVCTNGSESLIDLIARTFAGPGDEILFPEHSFPMYPIVTRAAGAQVVEAPAPDLTADVDALLARITPRTKVIFIANPNNPTGTCIDKQKIAALLKAVPSHIVVGLDSAYGEYVDDPSYSDGFEFIAQGHRNVIVLKTFSKIYALAALRLGWGYAAPEVVELMMRVRPPFNVSSLAAAAGCAALAEPARIKEIVAHTRHWRERLMRILNDGGLHTTDSVCNFVVCRFNRRGSWQRADEILKSHGIIVRPLPALNALRITIGTTEENDLLVAALADVIADSQGSAFLESKKRSAPR